MKISEIHVPTSRSRVFKNLKGTNINLLIPILSWGQIPSWDQDQCVFSTTGVRTSRPTDYTCCLFSVMFWLETSHVCSLTHYLPFLLCHNAWLSHCMLCRNFLQDKTFQLEGRLIKTEAVKHPSPQGKLLNFRKSLKLTEYAKCPRSPSLYKQEGLLKDPVRPAQLSGENRDPLNSLEGNSPNCWAACRLCEWSRSPAWQGWALMIKL